MPHGSPAALAAARNPPNCCSYQSKAYFTDVHQTSEPYLAFKVRATCTAAAGVGPQGCRCGLGPPRGCMGGPEPAPSCHMLDLDACLTQGQCCHLVLQAAQAPWRKEHAVEVTGQSYFETGIGHMAR